MYVFRQLRCIYVVITIIMLHLFSLLIFNFVSNAIDKFSILNVIVYYVLPVIFLILVFSLLFINRSISVNICLVITSILIVIYPLETYLLINNEIYSLPDWHQTIITNAKKYDQSYDTRSPNEYLFDLRYKGIDAYPYFPPIKFVNESNKITNETVSIDGKRVFPLAAISNKTHVYCNELGYWMTFSTDKYGFNNPSNINHMNADIVAIGDSYTFGACIEENSNAIAHIRKVYPNTVNLGVPASGPFVELAIFKEYAVFLKPKILLWFFYTNDFIDLNREKYDPILQKYLEDDYINNNRELTKKIDNELKRIAFLNRTDPFYEENIYSKIHYREYFKFTRFFYLRQWFWNRIKNIDMFNKDDRNSKNINKKNVNIKEDFKSTMFEKKSQSIDVDYTKIPEMTDENIRIYKKILDIVNKKVKSWNGKMYFVIFQQPSDSYKKIAFELGIPVIDVSHNTEGDNPAKNKPFGCCGHFSKDGYRIFGESVVAELEKF